MTAEPVYTIGRFEIIRPLGRGSQGSVYLARDPALDRLVALKLLKAAQDELQVQTKNGAPMEGVIASKLNHPNIVPIYEAGTDELGQYLVFEFVEGRTLSGLIKENGPFDIESAVPVIAAVLDGMAAAHDAEILHLDLSPRNVLMSDSGVPRIMDFGLSQFASVTREPGDFATGTLRYMSPEHFYAQPLGSWTDVFALGSTFFELVTNLHAMQGGRMEDVRDRIVKADVNFDGVLTLKHGEAFARFLSGALTANPTARYNDASAMREAFGLFLEEIGLEERSEDGGSRHSTIDFLLRRMKRKNDFPTISSTLTDINRLTSQQAETSAEKLANVVLRDMSLTSKLLKLVNSAFYGVRAAEVTSISQAIVFLGFEQVRMTANSLTLFGHLKGDSAVLKEAMVRSFLAGLLSRHLAQQFKLADVEEAFIAGMCRNLGENLVIHYFPDEYEEIAQLRESQSLDRTGASRAVLGVTYAELGAAVADAWGLPKTILSTVRGLPPGPVREPQDEIARQRDLCVLSNKLCELFDARPAADINETVIKLLEDFEPSVALTPDYTARLLNAGLEKLKAYAPIFEVDVARSDLCRSIELWVEAFHGDAERDRQTA